jgi:hypothetical protein
MWKGQGLRVQGHSLKDLDQGQVHQGQDLDLHHGHTVQGQGRALQGHQRGQAGQGKDCQGIQLSKRLIFFKFMNFKLHKPLCMCVLLAFIYLKKSIATYLPLVLDHSFSLWQTKHDS